MAPHIAFFNDVILQKDELLSFFKFLQHGVKHILAQWEKRHSCMVVQREGAAPVEIAAEIVRSGAVILQFLKHTLRLLRIYSTLLNLLINQLLSSPVTQVRLRKEKERGACQRYDRNDEHPAQSGGRIHFAVEQIDYHADSEYFLQHEHD